MGPLAGIRILEFAGIGPGPMAAMLLADLGATVLRLDRTVPSGLGLETPPHLDFTLRNRVCVAVDLKRPEGAGLALRLLGTADALIEGFRPGTMERLGLGPEPALAANPRLVYGRMTGFGQHGPLAHAAGHDLNYIALSGALASIGRAGQKPTPPLNLVGDYAGGALYLVVGLLAAILEARASGRGQVVDAAMTDGSAHLMTPIYGMAAAGQHGPERGRNLLDTGAPFYEVYECRDGAHVAVAPIEPKFRAELLARLGLPPGLDGPELGERLDTLFRTRTRAEWCELLEGTDCCFAPVLTMAEAPAHPHNAARRTFVEVDGRPQPAPAPRFSRTEPPPPTGPDLSAASGRRALADWGLAPDEIDALGRTGALRLV